MDEDQYGAIIELADAELKVATTKRDMAIAEVELARLRAKQAEHESEPAPPPAAPVAQTAHVSAVPAKPRWDPSGGLPEALPRSAKGTRLARGALKTWGPRMLFLEFQDAADFGRAEIREAVTRRWPSDTVARQSIDALIALCLAGSWMQEIPGVTPKKFRWEAGVRPP